MKVKHLLALTLVSLGLVTLFAHASTPQEEISNRTSMINAGAQGGVNSVAIDYAERAIAYSKAGQWQNSLNDSAWLKQNKIFVWSTHSGLPEARTKAYLALGRTDEAVQDMYETFLASGRSLHLRRLKDFISKNPQYSGYLDLDARADLIQKYSNFANNLRQSANYTSGIRDTENSWYMLKVAERMTNRNDLVDMDKQYDIMATVGYNRWFLCKTHSDDPAYGKSDATRENFLSNGSIACSYVSSKEGTMEILNILETFGQVCEQNYGHMRNDTKNCITQLKKELGISATTSSKQTVSTSQSTTNYNSTSAGSTTTGTTYSNTAFDNVNNTINTVNEGVQGVNEVIKGVNMIKSGLKGFGL